MDEQVPDALTQGLDSLQSIGSCEVLDGWSWRDDLKRWSLRLRITRKAPSTTHVPRSTEWFFFCEPIYPWGNITVYPAKENGLAATFPHQNHNAAGAPELPWRTGNVCLESSVRILSRRGNEQAEPFGENDRLAWRVLRLEEWLRRAARGELFALGDPFELPDYSPTPLVLAFDETPLTLARWKEQDDLRSGTVELVRGDIGWYCASHFMTTRSRTVLQVPWGTALKQPDPNTVSIGAWVRLDSVPVLRPWHAPRTWGELRVACLDQGVDLDAVLFPLLCYVRKSTRPLLLLGFPVPQTIGGSAERMHWLALRLNLAHRVPKGFRTNELGYLRFDRHNGLADDKPLEWLTSQNWARDQISTRGRLASELISKPILLIGAGALGSAIGELLVRGGASDVTVVDKDLLEAGNLVRHTADLRSVGALKADDLATRLNSISPHADVVGICKAFPNFTSEERESIDRCEIIIDTTAEDDVLEEMTHYPWDASKLFVSLSLGRRAQRLFCFATLASSFSHQEFRSAIRPWLSQEVMESELANEGPQWMGIGCWHPIFPAAVDDIRLMAAVAVKELQRLATVAPFTPLVSVWEQTEDDSRFSGVQRANLEDDEEGHDE